MAILSGIVGVCLIFFPLLAMCFAELLGRLVKEALEVAAERAVGSEAGGESDLLDSPGVVGDDQLVGGIADPEAQEVVLEREPGGTHDGSLEIALVGADDGRQVRAAEVGVEMGAFFLQIGLQLFEDTVVFFVLRIGCLFLCHDSLYFSLQRCRERQRTEGHTVNGWDRESKCGGRLVPIMGNSQFSIVNCPLLIAKNPPCDVSFFGAEFDAYFDDFTSVALVGDEVAFVVDLFQGFFGASS